MIELALHVLDVVQNSLAAGATRVEIEVCEDIARNSLSIEVIDNGRGMTPAQCQAALDPFVTSRSSRNVGLGLPLLKLAAEQAGGRMQVQSSPGEGTAVRAEFQYDHWDRAPLGDMSQTLVSILTLNESCHLLYRHRRGTREFHLDSEEMKAMLGEVPFSHPEVAMWLGQYVKENEELLEV